MSESVGAYDLSQLTSSSTKFVFAFHSVANRNHYFTSSDLTIPEKLM